MWDYSVSSVRCFFLTVSCSLSHCPTLDDTINEPSSALGEKNWRSHIHCGWLVFFISILILILIIIIISIAVCTVYCLLYISYLVDRVCQSSSMVTYYGK